VLSFNFTHADIDHSGGFGIVILNTNWLREATTLFETDCTRMSTVPRLRGIRQLSPPRLPSSEVCRRSTQSRYAWRQ
jgi:hypothetical protein